MAQMIGGDGGGVGGSGEFAAPWGSTWASGSGPSRPAPLDMRPCAGAAIRPMNSPLVRVSIIDPEFEREEGRSVPLNVIHFKSGAHTISARPPLLLKGAKVPPKRLPSASTCGNAIRY